ncbi:hypothetical protein C2E20_0967 [Micractinium conductrix]|uniref:Uncharacterized protein n=1 Tax=Micractinium conductrix TaxID=554055 RepID=A0A2P6VNK5_9CHLO|nr:hypothetical protein C2E20_0967 [Micractinium conductrix]|eukprot:PSC75637.1 hypothetical protein C2E20_0967 [Micractinium conductrix]
MSGRAGGRAAAADTAAAPRSALQPACVTLDGSLLDADAAARSVGGSSIGVRGGQSPARPAGSAGCRRMPVNRQRSGVPRESTGPVLLDKGESEAAFIATLRTHYTRNGTAESFAPSFKAAPHKTYSRTASGVAGQRAGSAGSAGSAPRSGAARLQAQEEALWEEREEELLDAQQRRFAQLEDALAAREAKREAYLVHRLEASAADKIAEHRRRQDAASRERLAAVQRAQHLPAIKQAQAAARPASGAAALHKLACRPVFASSPGLAAAIEQAAAGIASLPGISTLQAGVDSGGAFSPGAAGGIAGLPGTQRPGWQDRKRTAAAAQVDAVYAQIQAVKATGGALLSPLDAAREPPGGAATPATAAPTTEEEGWMSDLHEDTDLHTAAYEARQLEAAAQAQLPPSALLPRPSGGGVRASALPSAQREASWRAGGGVAGPADVAGAGEEEQEEPADEAEEAAGEEEQEEQPADAKDAAEEAAAESSAPALPDAVAAEEAAALPATDLPSHTILDGGTAEAAAEPEAAAAEQHSDSQMSSAEGRQRQPAAAQEEQEEAESEAAAPAEEEVAHARVSAPATDDASPAAEQEEVSLPAAAALADEEEAGPVPAAAALADEEEAGPVPAAAAAPDVEAAAPAPAAQDDAPMAADPALVVQHSPSTPVLPAEEDSQADTPGPSAAAASEVLALASEASAVGAPAGEQKTEAAQAESAAPAKPEAAPEEAQPAAAEPEAAADAPAEVQDTEEEDDAEEDAAEAAAEDYAAEEVAEEEEEEEAPEKEEEEDAEEAAAEDYAAEEEAAEVAAEEDAAEQKEDVTEDVIAAAEPEQLAAAQACEADGVSCTAGAAAQPASVRSSRGEYAEYITHLCPSSSSSSDR